jgi:transketolase
MQNMREMANAIRFLSMDAIQQAKSGHPGMPMGMADVATVLFSKFLKFNPKQPKWFDRDRFVLSAGHGSMLLYSLLYLTGYEDITIDDIKNFRQLKSKTAGHPEYGHLEGIDMTTGPLGQGISSAVGMALSERMMAAKYGEEVCNHYTYTICGDGCLMEGISEEAISFAGHHKLNKLIVLWDNNQITIDGKTDVSTSTNQLKRFKANGWDVQEIDGHNYKKIEKAIKKAQKSKLPSLISCKTKIGFGSPNKEGTSKCHGSPLGEEEIQLTREKLNWTAPAFEIPKEILSEWRKVGAKNVLDYKIWEDNANRACEEFTDVISGRLPRDWDKGLNELKQKAIDENMKIATRKSSQICLEKIVPAIPQIVGGSADLACSNLTSVDSMSKVTKEDYDGNCVYYGIREHAMGAIMNGMALHGGMIPYGGTFLVFSDYLRPSMRLAALMEQKVIYVLTHDSIGVGEDGPTHQPIEHLAAYRCMPNINVFRPCDVVETAEAWQISLASDKTPSMLALTRQNLPMVRKSTDENMTVKGGYVISDVEDGKRRVATIIATGSEVHLAVEAQKTLKEEGVDVAVVSMPCQELFDKQSLEYKAEVLGLAPRLAVEALTKYGWEKYVGLDGEIIGMDGFGASGPGNQLFEYFNITKANVIAKVKKIIS